MTQNVKKKKKMHFVTALGLLASVVFEPGINLGKTFTTQLRDISYAVHVRAYKTYATSSRKSFKRIRF